MHNWSDGEVQSTYPLGDYKSKFGTVRDPVLWLQYRSLPSQDYYNFHRIDIHKQLLKSAFEEPGEGPTCVLKVNHKATEVDYDQGLLRFENGIEESADLIVAADGIRVSQSMVA